MADPTDPVDPCVCPAECPPDLWGHLTDDFKQLVGDGKVVISDLKDAVTLTGKQAATGLCNIVCGLLAKIKGV